MGEEGAEAGELRVAGEELLLELGAARAEAVELLYQGRLVLLVQHVRTLSLQFVESLPELPPFPLPHLPAWTALLIGGHCPAQGHVALENS